MESRLIVFCLVVMVFASSYPTIFCTGSETNDGELPYLGVSEMMAPSYTVNFYGGGGFQISIGGEEYTFEASFSYPNAGYNKLTSEDEADRSGEAEWNVEIKTLNSNVTEIRCKGKYYQLIRLIIRDDHRIRIRDTFKNLRDEDLGVIISNKIVVKGNIGVLYIAGRRYSAESDVTLELKDLSQEHDWSIFFNPTLLIGQEATGIGVLVEDDVYRNQLSIRYYYSHSLKYGSLYTSHFGLSPGSSYTLEWSIYPLSPPDYWNFINIVRSDLGVNFAIDGPLTFQHPNSIMEMPVEELRRLIKQKAWRLVALRPWFDYYDGYRMTEEEFADLVKPAITRLKEADPNVVPLFMLEPPLKILHKSEVSGYKDSVPVTIDGEPSLCERYNQKVISRLGLSSEYGLYDAYVTLDNRRFRELIGFIDFAMDECGFEGVYFDSFFGYTYSTYYTYDRWDNHTVDIDPEKFTIVRRYATLALITKDAMRSLVEHINSKGGVVVTNSRPPVRSTQSIRMNSFAEKNMHVEGPYVERSAASVHLYTPINLGDQRIYDSQKDFMDDVRLQLRHGVLYYPYNYRGEEGWGVLRRMFPFTPIEIHGGRLIGEERIITLESGTYGWDDNSTIICHLFDADGVEIPARFFHVWSAGGKTYVNVTLEEGQIAILERREAGLRPRSPTASFTYSPQNPNDLQPVKFTDTSRAVEGNIVCWYWDFGDGTYSTERNPVHTYAYSGEYTVTLWVGDENGVVSVYSLKVRVAGYRIPVMAALLSLAGTLIYLIVRRWRAIIEKWRKLMKYPLPDKI